MLIEEFVLFVRFSGIIREMPEAIAECFGHVIRWPRTEAERAEVACKFFELAKIPYVC